MPDTEEDNIDWSLLGKRVLQHFKKTARFTGLLGMSSLISIELLFPNALTYVYIQEHFVQFQRRIM